METYFKIKSFIEFGLPAFLCGFVIIGSVIFATIESIKEEKNKEVYVR